MFNNPYLGVILENIRSLSFSLMASSLLIPIFSSETITILLGIFIGSYYGYRMEKQTHELSSLGGRILKCRNWDYLILV
jgi:hypothetical protein